MGKATSPFGKFNRVRRIDLDVTLHQMAEALGISGAYLSRMELGKTAIPPGVIHSIIQYFELDALDEAELKHKAMLSQPKVTIDLKDMSSTARVLAHAIAGSLHNLDEDVVRKLYCIVDEHVNGTLYI